MKKVGFILLGILLFTFITVSTNAQNSDFFVGKWKVLVEGTPNGDATSTFVFRRVDGKLTGETISEGQAPIKFSRIEENNDEVTAYFTSSGGYEVYLYIEKVDENHVEGSMMDMFDASGERIIEESK